MEIRDGYTSASSLIMYIRKNFPDLNVNYLMHSKRANGLTYEIMEKVESLKPDFVILPDASSSDYEQHKKLSSLGIDVMCLDHHEILDGESEHAIVVNPQLSPDYINKEISGAGVTYRFLQALDDYYGLNDADSYLDLIALGNVTDAMDLSQLDTRYIVYKGLEKLNNLFLKELAFKNAGWTKGKINPQIIGWQLAPKFNALIRVGTNEEKDDVFRAMLGEEEIFYNKRTKKEEKLHEKAVRLCTNAYAKQKRIRTKLVEEIKVIVKEQDLDQNAFIFLRLDRFEKGLSGYIAGGLTNVYKKPVLLTTWDEEEQLYKGSLRGYSGGQVDDVKGFLEETKLFANLAGHSNAAGISITKENAEKLNETINKKLTFKSKTSSEPIEVDFVIDSKALTVPLIEEVQEIEKYFSKGFSPAKFAVTNVELNCSDIVFKNSMKATKGNIELLCFTIDSRLQKLALENKMATVDIVGELGVNHFLGNETPQVKIEAIDIKEIKDRPTFGFVF